MTLIKTLKLYRQLSGPQKQFIANSGIQSKMSARQWIRFFEPLCEFDENSDQARKPLWTILIASGILVFLSFFILPTLGNTYATTMFYSVMGTFLLICGVLLKRLHKNDINNNIREVLYPLLHVLSLEVGNKKPIMLNINFAKKMHKKEIMPAADNNSVLKKGNDVYYEYEVLELSSTFLDQTKLTWKVVDKIRKRTRTNARGKTKTKVKLKRKVYTEVSFNKALYSLNRNEHELPSSLGKVKVGENKITFRSVLKQTELGKTATIDRADMLSAVEGPYQYLTCKQGVAI
ncbi:MAG: hypothetical protein KUG82_20285 [Pseudomonadales bacterium]|nr:hypothetical protein [Pseudomonadales bacterium]